MIPSCVRLKGLQAIQLFERSLLAGGTPAFAEMVAMQCPPGSKGTDRSFMEGRYNGGYLDGLPPKQAKWMVTEAQAAGINPTGKVYMGGLADHRAHRDPEAWIDSVADVMRVAKKRNLNVQGAVSHTAEPVAPQRKVLSESIIKDEMTRKKKTGTKLNDSELREYVIDKHSLKTRKL